jgi:hypothetical protein
MENLSSLVTNLTSPAVLAFFLGAFACLMKSDLRVPQQVYDVISQYLLFAIGLKGGFAIAEADIAQLVSPVTATIILGSVTPLIGYLIARHMGRLSKIDAAAVAAHYGSVSAVTFIAAISFVQFTYGENSYDHFMVALLAVLEIPAILLALVMATYVKDRGSVPLGEVIGEVFTGKTMILLIGGMAIGMISGKPGKELVETVFIIPFQGVLVFFMLEMGIVAAERLREIQRRDCAFILLFGTFVPLIYSTIGIAIGHYAGLEGANLLIFATMAASASYIAAPAAIRMSLPEANPAIYLTASLGVTLPFNLLVGIPLYREMVNMLAPMLG